VDQERCQQHDVKLLVEVKRLDPAAHGSRAAYSLEHLC
jgi:hypothetical protein